MSTLQERAEVTGWLLVSESVRHLPTRPWAIELALRRLHQAATFPALVDWASESAFGVTFPKLIEVVWTLVDDGALCPATAPGRSVYTVNSAWQEQARQSLGSISPSTLKLVTQVSDYLASVAATPVTA